METLTQERLHFLLKYNQKTGAFTWNVRRGGKANAGTRSECLDSKGYYRVGIDGKRYLAHRLAWFYVYGVWPDGVIDHVNRNRTDNRLCNLRAIPASHNAWNRGKSTAHDNPALGVSYDKATTRKSKWFAYITRNKKRIGLGHYATLEEAVAARAKAEQAFGANSIKRLPHAIYDHTPRPKGELK